MKIAIQGHPTRGEEVIQILESLGGKNIHKLCGNGKDRVYHYHINSCGIIAFSSKYELCDYKLYTLAGFKKEFPFKVGDKVKHISSTGIIKGYCYMSNEPAYEVESMELGIVVKIFAKILKPYKEMKEERNITLTLEKAKEWYKKGGELKEIALQAFNEKELTKTDLPKTWEEFCKNYPIKEGESYIGNFCAIMVLHKSDEGREIETDSNVCPSQKSAEAHLAMIQLEQLRDCWRQENIPQVSKYKIKKIKNKYTVVYGVEDAFLSFCDNQTAEEFLECFKDLIEKAGDLI